MKGRFKDGYYNDLAATTEAGEIKWRYRFGCWTMSATERTHSKRSGHADHFIVLSFVTDEIRLIVNHGWNLWERYQVIKLGERDWSRLREAILLGGMKDE